MPRRPDPDDRVPGMVIELHARSVAEPETLEWLRLTPDVHGRVRLRLGDREVRVSRRELASALETLDVADPHWTHRG